MLRNTVLGAKDPYFAHILDADTELLAAWNRYRDMVEDAELARVLGVGRDPLTLEDLPADFVDWCRHFVDIDKRLEAASA